MKRSKHHVVCQSSKTKYDNFIFRLFEFIELNDLDLLHRYGYHKCCSIKNNENNKKLTSEIKSEQIDKLCNAVFKHLVECMEENGGSVSLISFGLYFRFQLMISTKDLPNFALEFPILSYVRTQVANYTKGYTVEMFQKVRHSDVNLLHNSKGF